MAVRVVNSQANLSHAPGDIDACEGFAISIERVEQIFHDERPCRYGNRQRDWRGSLRANPPEERYCAILHDDEPPGTTSDVKAQAGATRSNKGLDAVGEADLTGTGGSK